MKIRLTKKNQVQPKTLINRKTHGLRLFLLSTVIFLGFSMTDANAQDLKVSISQQSIAIKDVLQRIEKQTTYLFVYNRAEIDLDQKVNVNVSDASVKNVLSDILKGQNLSFYQEGNNIVLQKSHKSGEVKKQITGVVKDLNDEPLIGASIKAADSAIGTITDIDGNYTLSVSVGSVIEVAYIGYISQTVTISGKNNYDFVLKESDKELKAVVVTALGIKREEKALSYNVQQISSDDITTVKDLNFVNSLAGKVAGVTINSSAGVGGASRVVMRGVKSISKDNNALYVIDGVPIYNKSGGAIDKNYTYADQPQGEGISDLSPDDIESMSVLTGPSASALYGSSAANGVIIITTKKGKSGKPRVTISNQLTYSEALNYYEFQNKYGKAQNQYGSWGPELEGPGYDRLDFFKTGVTNQTAASVSVGSDKSQTYASISHSYSEGVIPTNNYKKTNLTLRNTTSFLNDKMTLDFGFSYIKQSDKNIIGQGQYFNPLPIVYTFPVGHDLLSFKDNFETYDNAMDLPIQNWPEEYKGILDGQNPYWLLKRMPVSNSRDRYMMNVNLKYEITDWMNVAGRVRFDHSNSELQSKFYATTDSKFAHNEFNGKYKNVLDNDKQTYADLILTINKTFGDFSLVPILGTSFSDIKTLSKGIDGSLVVPNYFAFSNIDMKADKTRPIHNGWHEQQQSIFTNIEVGYKHMLYLTLTGRNEWASQLANTEKSSFLYGSAGMSFLLSEAVKLPEQISYLQLKGSYASVGSPIPRNLSIKTFPFNEGNNSYEARLFKEIANLKPERTNSWEIGMSTKLFGDKLNLDFTYYHSNTLNQLLSLDVSATSGYPQKYIQAGNVRNNGLELAIGSNLEFGNLSWNSSFTAGYNKNKILELYDGSSGSFEGRREAIGASTYFLEVGGSMGDLYVTKALKTDANGTPILDGTEKKPTFDDLTFPDGYVGSVLPKWNLGFRNSFLWKDFNFGFMLSARLGGVVMSPTEAILDGYGVTKKIAEARDRGAVVVGDIVFDPQDYYKTIGSREGLLSDYVYKADNVRLQEVSVGYTFPRKLFNNKMKLNLSFVASNLWLIYKDAPFDPELTGNTGTYFQGIDFFMQPSTRNLGFSVKVEF